MEKVNAYLVDESARLDIKTEVNYVTYIDQIDSFICWNALMYWIFLKPYFYIILIVNLGVYKSINY